jgi:hypothetical protein
MFSLPPKFQQPLKLDRGKKCAVGSNQIGFPCDTIVGMVQSRGRWKFVLFGILAIAIVFAAAIRMAASEKLPVDLAGQHR